MSKYGKHQMKVTISTQDGLAAELICDHENADQCEIPEVFDSYGMAALEGYRDFPHTISVFPIEITNIDEYEFYWRLRDDNE